MTSIKLIVSGASARAEVDGLLTSGMVGIPVTITYDSAWDGLTKALVCRGGSVIRTILEVGDAAAVPHECMVPNQTLFIGIEGRNADGTLVIPTIWARCGLICSGANAEADPSTDPTLPVWAQIESKIGSLDNLNTQAKENIVAAINEAMTKGGGEVDPEAVQRIVDDYLAENPPASGADGKDGVTPHIGDNGNWYLGAEDTGKPSRGATGAKGDTGATGPQGEQGPQGPAGAYGKSAYQYAVDGGYTGTEAEFAEKLAQEYPDGIVEASGGTVTEGNLVVWDADRSLVRDGGAVPEKLPNPNALTFTGAVTGSYDGSAPLEVEIPSCGSGGYPVVDMTADTAELAPNTYYRWGEIAALSVTLATPSDTTITNEYCFEFVSGETATTLTVPSGIQWAQEPMIEAGKTYQVSILNKIGVIVGA